MRTLITDDADAAVAGIADGSTILIGGFGMAGMPVILIDALIRQGAGDLTVVNNNAGNGDTGATRASTSLKASVKSRRINDRTFCAFK